MVVPLVRYDRRVDDPDTDLPQISDDALSWGLCFEVGFGVIALLIGGQIGVWPAEKLPLAIPPMDFLLGAASAMPLLAILIAARRIQWKPIKGLTEFVDTRLLPLFRGLSVLELFLISLAAGWGEELLFRGLIQAGLGNWTPPLIAILLTSVLFGLFHFVSPAYFVAALLVSVYFGWLFWQFDSLWIPILSHTVYDFLMLLFVRRQSANHASSSKGLA